jgi:hypothetical protein
MKNYDDFLTKYKEGKEYEEIKRNNIEYKKNDIFSVKNGNLENSEQFSKLYNIRFQILKNKIIKHINNDKNLKKCKLIHKIKVKVIKIVNVESEEEECIIIGTLFKKMNLKESLLSGYLKEVKQNLT